MAKSRGKRLGKLRQLQQERRELLPRLTRQDQLAIGTVSVVQRKCGNPRCHCAQGPEAHPQTLFLFKDKQTDKRRCKLVRRADEPFMLQAGKCYRKFRDDLKRFRAIHRQEVTIVMALAGERAITYD